MGLDMYLEMHRTVSAEQMPEFAKQQLKEDAERAAQEGWDKEEDWELDAYFSGYSFYSEEAQARYRAIIEAAGLANWEDAGTPSVTVRPLPSGDYRVEAHVGYWRKANAIHAWFVRECQGGVDECQTSDAISREKLEELRNLVQTVLDGTRTAEGEVVSGQRIGPGMSDWENIYEPGRVNLNPTLAHELLPAQKGFFFGGAEYDEWYIQKLEQTIPILNRAMSVPADVTIHYHSSW